MKVRRVLYGFVPIENVCGRQNEAPTHQLSGTILVDHQQSSELSLSCFGVRMNTFNSWTAVVRAYKFGAVVVR